jgi:excisionase family DNA binding protein
MGAEKVEHIKILRVEEVAKLVKMSKFAIYNMAKKKEIPSFKIGKSVRFFEDEIIAWIKALR